MNVYNDMSETFESSLKNQFEMQSCKVNKSESKPNNTLKKIGQELDKAETKCFTLKSELNYMMGVCRKAQTEIRGSKEPSDVSLIMSPSKNSGFKSPVEHNDDYNSEITGKITNCNITQRTCNVELKNEENFDPFDLSSKFAQFSPRKNVDDNITERLESSMEERQKGLLNVTITPRSQLDKKLPCSITVPIPDEITEHTEYGNYYFPSSTSQVDEDYFRLMLSSAKRHDVEDSGLNLDAPSVVKVRRMKKSRSRTGRSEINSVYRKSNAISKGRKRKAKLQSSISKSTVTTKDTGFISREEVKKRRRKGFSVHQQSNLPKHLRKFNDVVEIFHNTKLKKSNSRVSNKCSKDRAKYEKKLHLPETKEAPRKIQETLMLSPKSKCLEHVNRKVHDKENEKEHCISHDKQNEQDNGSHGKSIEKNHCGSHDKKNQQQLQTLNNKNNSEATPEVAQEQNKSEKNSKDLSPSTKNETRQCKRAFSRYDDPTFMASYEMPTLASKLKRSCRSYYSRYNFRNIPFVVGTSVTPSHNLGLNIQQVLSVMKMRQSIASDITPSLIRKVSRGIKPMSIFLDQMNGHYEGSVLDVSSQMSGTFNCVENIGKNKRLSAFNLQPVNKTQSGCVTKASVDAENISEKQINVSKQSCKGKSDSCDNRTKQQASSTVSKSNIQANPKHQQGISLKGNIDHKIHIPDLHNSNEIRDVLIKLHDQLEQMNTKYERLQSQVDKSSDKSLTNELSAMEKELNAKEEEINAVVGLYKEVMMLKQQMKMLHERNSLVCIATESIKDTRRNPFSFSMTPGKSRSMDPVQILSRRKLWNAAREPPASMQLAALLRQIQTFHKQLQLVS